MIKYIILFPFPVFYALNYNGNRINPIISIILFSLDIIIYFFILKKINYYYKNRLVCAVSTLAFLFILFLNLIVIFLYFYLSSSSFCFKWNI